jgi:hypothetical protein
MRENIAAGDAACPSLTAFVTGMNLIGVPGICKELKLVGVFADDNSQDAMQRFRRHIMVSRATTPAFEGLVTTNV